MAVHDSLDKNALFSAAVGSGLTAFLLQRPSSVGCSFLGGGTPLMCLQSVVCLGSAATLGFLAGGIAREGCVQRRLSGLTRGRWSKLGDDNSWGSGRMDRVRWSGSQQCRPVACRAFVDRTRRSGAN